MRSRRSAPTAARSASSRERADVLTSNRLATFTQTMRSSKPTAPKGAGAAFARFRPDAGRAAAPSHRSFERDRGIRLRRVAIALMSRSAVST